MKKTNIINMENAKLITYCSSRLLIFEIYMPIHAHSCNYITNFLPLKHCSKDYIQVCKFQLVKKYKRIDLSMLRLTPVQYSASIALQ